LSAISFGEKEVYLMKIILLLFALSLFGCASDVANRYYLSERFPPKEQSDVLILHSKPSKLFVVIADFQSRGESASDLQEKAAEIGADAVIVTTVGGYYSHSEEWASQDRYKNKYHSHIVGTAIKFTED